MGLQVLVTRPAEQAGEWVDALRRRGIDALPLPLLQIDATADRPALQAAWSELPRQAVVMFVSSNAVQQFWAAAPPGAAWPNSVRAAAPGPGTAQALLAHGLARPLVLQPPADSPSFDSEHLWPLLQGEDWRGRRVLIVRGDGGRDWLAERWRAAGAQVHTLEAYRRVGPAWDAAQQACVDAALARPQSHLWLLSSSQAVQMLAARVRLPVGARALATHPAIARSARDAGFTEVHEASGGFDAVVACLESLG